MTMIRINLIAEKKAGAPKAAKKPSRQQSEIQENLILIIGVAIAVAVVFFMWNSVTKSLDAEVAKNKKLTVEYNKIKHYQEKKERYEIQKELLNEKIQKISDLKDLREGPVKLMEDIYNALPDSVWLSSIWQGYNRKLTLATRSEGKAFSPGKNLGEPALVQVVGFAKTTESVTNFANRILSLDSRYYNTELNNYSRVGEKDGSKEYRYEIFFKVKRGSPKKDAKGGDGG